MSISASESCAIYIFPPSNPNIITVYVSVDRSSQKD